MKEVLKMERKIEENEGTVSELGGPGEWIGFEDV